MAGELLLLGIFNGAAPATPDTFRPALGWQAAASRAEWTAPATNELPTEWRSPGQLIEWSAP